MKSTFFTFLSFFLFIACKKEIKPASRNWQIISENVKFKDDVNTLQLKSGKFDYALPTSKLPFKKVILLNASLVGYFTELGLEGNIIGISSPEYVYSKKVHQLIEEGKMQTVGNEQKYDMEKIIALKPDVIFTNYIASFENTYDLIKKNGIEIIFINEYLEQNPLEKSKYLLIFGKLLNNEKKAVTKIEEIQKSYDSLKTLANTAANKPIVLANEMYGNQWFLPGGKSNLAQFISDANGKYINADNSETKAIPMSFEEVFVKAQKAQYWVNVGNHQNRNELLQINPNYTKLPVYNNGEMYTITGRTNGKSNDYFESGVVRADLVLKDYIKIFHPELLPNYQLTYLSELK
ncbi:ABC transporter substrate-binding protein [Kaistella antarctica]|uniref:ABC transporter substrate-binding protein n=1 Tax=Kaistella antarctica TaxID=266748 RepID=A0A3S4W1T0_9FLAO|nr:ABC transporter substrate-binding protein [Kaistella antarctica]KEY19692.1 ABC transporter substrate-binding protein [Kaistella antarctica]SEV98897.1 iron complex transport system substrate-binding protein [Kaistella antarctica]VEH96734.1 vitamin B12-transporter protein BtuF [Kaistella antarctica]